MKTLIAAVDVNRSWESMHVKLVFPGQICFCFSVSSMVYTQQWWHLYNTWFLPIPHQLTAAWEWIPSLEVVTVTAWQFLADSADCSCPAPTVHWTVPLRHRVILTACTVTTLLFIALHTAEQGILEQREGLLCTFNSTHFKLLCIVCAWENNKNRA